MKKFIVKIVFFLSTVNMKSFSKDEIIEINKTNIDSYRINDIIYSKEIIKKRFQKGYKLYTLLDNEIPVSFAWVKQSSNHFIGELNKEIEFKDKVNCIIDCFTIPEARGKGHYSSLISYISNKENQFPTIIYTHNTNIPSRKGIEKAGFKEKFEITKFLFWYFKSENSGINYKLI